METQPYTFSRKIPVMAEPEILVIGGGPAGIAAAVCAARRGKKVLLAEREYCLGGTATSGLVGPFMTCSDPEGKTKLIRGFFEDLVNRMVAQGGAEDPMSIINGDAHSSWHIRGHHNVTPFSSETLKFVAEQMCLEYGVQLLYGVQLVDMIRDESGKRIASVVFAAKEGMISIRPKFVIDCTGDGDAAFFAGCPMMKGDEKTGELQAAGLFFSVAGLDEAVLQKRSEELGWESMRFEKEIAEAVANGEYPIPRRRLGLYKSCDGTWRANITRIPEIDGTKSEDLTNAAVTGRFQINAIMKFLRKYVHGCENAYLVGTASTPGIRETRRIKGKFILQEKDLLDGTKFPDTILCCSNSRDVHTGMVGCYQPQKNAYYLPYRMLIPDGVDNMLAAGRNVSCDRAVLSAIRVMPPCFGMGQAAGNAAVLAIESGKAASGIDVKELQDRLRAENAVL